MMGHGWIAVSDHICTYLHTNMLIFDTVERVHWLRAKAQFQRWLEEDRSIHNEAEWVPSFFQARSEMWSNLKVTASQGSLRGHEAYASAQVQAWKELSISSKEALSEITSAPLKQYPTLSILLS
jgi:hypothetical protein